MLIDPLIRNGLMNFNKKDMESKVRELMLVCQDLSCLPSLLHQPAINPSTLAGFLGPVCAVSNLHGLPAIRLVCSAQESHCWVNPLPLTRAVCCWDHAIYLPLNSSLFLGEALECSSPALCSQLLPAALGLACFS